MDLMLDYMENNYMDNNGVCNMLHGRICGGIFSLNHEAGQNIDTQNQIDMSYNYRSSGRTDSITDKETLKSATSRQHVQLNYNNFTSFFKNVFLYTKINICDHDVMVCLN